MNKKLTKKETLKKAMKKPTLQTDGEEKQSVIIKKSEIDIRITRIRSFWQQYTELKSEIVRDLYYLQEHQDELKAEKGLTFKELLEELTGYSKSYYYQLTGNYKFLLEYNRLDLFEKVDTKIIEKIKSTGDEKEKKNLLNKAETLTREDFKKTVRPSDSDTNIKDTQYINIDPSPTHIIKDIPEPGGIENSAGETTEMQIGVNSEITVVDILTKQLLDYKIKLKPGIKDLIPGKRIEKSAINDMINGVIDTISRLHAAGLITDNELIKIQKTVKLEALDLKIEEINQNSFDN